MEGSALSPEMEGVRKVPGGRGVPLGCPGRSRMEEALCPERLPSSELPVFLPRRNNFLIPAQGAAAAGRSSRPQLCSHGAARLQCCPDRAVPSRAPSRGSQAARLQCPTLVRMPRRPQQPFLPGPQGRLGGFPAEGPGSLAFRECRHRGVMLRPPPSARVPSIRARWTWLSPDAHEGA